MTAIHTERLTLRPYEVADFTAYAAMVADPIVVHHAGGKPMTGEDAWMRLLRFIGHWSVFGHGLFAVLDRASGLYLGETGFMEYRREVTPKLAPIPEAAWVFTRAAHGQGYAFEAAAAAHRWMAETHAPASTQCIIAPANHGSIRLAEKLGYRLHDQPDYRGPARRYIRSAEG